MRSKTSNTYTISNILDYFSIGRVSFFLLISQIIIVGAYFLADIYFARTLTRQDFGTWKQFLLIAQFLVPLLFLGIPEGFRYYSALEKDRWYVHFFNAIIMALLLSGILFLLSQKQFLFILLEKLLNNPLLRGMNYLLPLVFLSMMIMNLQKYVFLLFEKTKYLIISSVLTALVLCSGFYVISHVKMPMPFISSISIVYIVSILLALILLSIVINVYKYIPRYKLSYLKESKKYIIYGFPVFLATIAGVIAQYTDKVIVSKLGGVKLFAVYSVGALEVPVITMIAASVSMAIYPKIVGLIKEKKEEDAKELWYKFTLRVSRITYPIIIFMIAFSDKIIKFFYTQKYAAAVPIFLVYLFLLFARNNSYGLILLGKGKTKVYFAGQAIETILNIILSVLLFHFIGMIGPAISTVILIYLLSMFYLYKEGVLVKFLSRFTKDMWLFVVVVSISALLIRVLAVRFL